MGRTGAWVVMSCCCLPQPFLRSGAQIPGILPLHMSRDVTFAMSPRGFDDLMMCMADTLPQVSREEFEDRWGSLMSTLQCVSDWAAAGHGQPWTYVVLCRLQSLCHLCIWGARAQDLLPHAVGRCMVMVPARYKVNVHGWQSIHGGDAYLAASSLRAKHLLCVLVWRLSKRQTCRKIMLWCLLAIDLLNRMCGHISARLRAV